jgi:hypothetical protein
MTVRTLAALALTALALTALALTLAAQDAPPQPQDATPRAPARALELRDEHYVGSETCRECHAENHASWQASFHRTMTQAPHADSVLAPFTGTTPVHEGRAWALAREGDAFLAQPVAPAADGDRPLGPRAPVALLTGSHHYQIYWLATEAGLEQLPLVWHVAEARWAPREAMFLQPPGPTLPETNRWQTTCIQCHATNGTPEHPDAGATRVAELGIACEACHGPGEAHAAWHRTEESRTEPEPARLSGGLVDPSALAPERSAEVCGQCHGIHVFGDADARARWERDGFDYRPGDELGASRRLLRGTPERNGEALRAFLARNPETLGELFWPDGELRARIADQAHGWLEARCAPDTQHSALAPVIDLLERALGLDQEATASGKVARLEAALAGLGLAPAEVMPLFLPLLALPLEAPYGPLEVSAPRQRALTLRAIASLLFAIAGERPVLLIVEDLHWADATTLELLAQLVREAPGAAMCVLMTARPEHAASFATAGVQTLPLGRLPRPQIDAMLGALVGGKPLPPAVLEHVADRADGVPLFVEELLRMLIDAGHLVERDDRYELTGPLAGAAIPGTLRALLAARLERLARARETAQLAAALGREFSVAVLSAASPLGPAEVAADLERLMHAGLVQRKRRGRDVVGVFKHALIRDAAYESLPAGARQQVHARIAGTLEERFP